MRNLMMALLLPLLLQTPTPNPPPAVPPNQAQGAPVEAQGSPRPAPESPAPLAPTGPSRRGSQESIDEFVERTVNEALSGLPSDGDPDLSPETEKAIENAVETFLSDPEIKSAIAAKINQVTMPWQSPSANLVAILVPMSFFAVIALIAWLFYRRSQARMRARMEFHQQVLSKFTSGQEFAQFLNTKGSQQLLEGMWGGQLNLKERLLKHVRLGAIFGVIGLGLLALAIFEGSGYGFLAVLSLGIGIGLLISARVSYRLSEKMGLLHDNDSRDSGNANVSESQL